MFFLRWLKRILPFNFKHSVKIWFLNHFLGNDTSSIKTQKIAKPKQLEGINIIGFSESATGLGESARSFAKSAEAVGIKTTAIPVTFSPFLALPQIPALHNFDLYSVNIFHINAILVEQAVPLMTGLFRDRYNIGYWHWELSDFPKKWSSAFQYFDEIWVPSEFVRASVEKISSIPVITVPHAIEMIDFEKRSRKYFKLPDEDFLVLSLFDVGSVLERKNPFAVVESYLKAFPEEENVTLVVKIRNGETNPQALAKLKDILQSVKSVLIDETFSKNDVWALIDCCDTYISLHRSEGFGMILAEAMLLEKPVVATNYSGNTDFCNSNNSYPTDFSLVEIEQDCSVYEAGNVWAEADTLHGSRHLRKIVSDYESAIGKGKVGKKTIEDGYSHKTIGGIYLEQFYAP